VADPAALAMLDPNNRLLVETLERLPLLEGRYENIRWISFNVATRAKRGCFSLVFRAHDKVDGVSVALKFYAIDPATTLNKYRRESFRREHFILQSLIGADRCLQVASQLNVFNLPVPPLGSHVFACEYFATDGWNGKSTHTSKTKRALMPLPNCYYSMTLFLR
jgi:hypothetical protein